MCLVVVSSIYVISLQFYHSLNSVKFNYFWYILRRPQKFGAIFLLVLNLLSNIKTKKKGESARPAQVEHHQDDLQPGHVPGDQHQGDEGHAGRR